ncbi:MAG: colicin E3/pyocin S6 family cytotoxin [Sterolibacterium sp.]
MGGVPIPAHCFLHRCQHLKVIDDKKVWRNASGNQFYTWDALHGEVEVFNKRGRHLGVMNPEGEFVKPAIRGRQLNV